MKAASLDRRITILRAVEPAGFVSAGQETWVPVAENVPANVQDALPSRGERLAEGLTIAQRPARIRIRWRVDITGDMRVQYGERVMEIIGGPAELGRREGLEMMAQDVR